MLKKLLLTLSAVGVMAAFASLPSEALAQNYPDSVKALVSETKKKVKTINMQQFKALVDQQSAGPVVDVRQATQQQYRASGDKQDAGLIIDVRQESEYEEGHVPGAINVPRGLIEFRVWKLVGWPDKTDMNKQMTLYCLTGGRCALAAKSLQDLGFTNVTSVDMRFEEWQKAGYPVAKPAK
jgi:rhodanese-related sulfurtransferase